MAATEAHAADRVGLQLHADLTEAQLIERVIAVARALLCMASLVIVRLDPPEPSFYIDISTAVLVAYAAFAVIVLLALLRARIVPAFLPVALQTADIGFATALTLFSAGPNSPFYTLLLYPLLAAAYRWGFREVMITAAIVDGLMAIEALIVSQGVFAAGLQADALEWNRFLMRALYVAATGAAVGYLAENEKRRRMEARDISLVLVRARLGGKLAETISLVLNSVRRVFRAKQVLLVMQEEKSDRLWLWTSPAGTAGSESNMPPELLPPAREADYMFDTPGAAWHAAVRLWPRGDGFSSVAVDELGQRLPAKPFALPAGFLAHHPCRRLIGVSLPLSEEWAGRLFIIGPGLGVHREQNARFALDITRHVGPAVYGHYLVRRLRTRAETLERARIARELHDGVTQSLLGLEMELVVLHRRATAQAPELADDLARAHQIVRKEVITVRELMEGIRVGDVESGDLLHHLSEMVDRFGRYTGVAARFVSDGQAVSLTPHVRRQVARIVHEALINVRKHADADRVMVRAEVDGTCWKLSIEDDGRGFPFAGRLSREELEQFRQGPKTIGERIRLIGGLMAVESKPGFGAKVEIAIPLRTS